MERLYQGHLHPKHEVPRMTCFGGESNLGPRGGSTLAKSYSNSVLTAIRNIYKLARDNMPSLFI